MINYIFSHMPMILTCLLTITEAAAAVTQVLFPDNKGISGIIAGLIKFLQSMGAKEST